MSDGIKPGDIRDLAYQYMKAGWQYGYMEASIEIFFSLMKRQPKRPPKFLWKYFVDEIRKENKYELSFCHRLLKMDDKERNSLVEKIKNGSYSIVHYYREPD